MSTRRTVLAGLLALPWAARGAPAVASGDGLFVGQGGVGRKLPWSAVRLDPLDNANTSYFLQFTVARFPDDQQVWLVHDGQQILSNSRGGDDTTWTVSFQLQDRATVDRLAAWLGMVVPERRPLGLGLRSTWEATGGTTIRVTLTNDGDVPVGVVVGGRNRGPRDNQFSFTVRRGDEILPTKDGGDFGGLSVVRPLEPGGSTSIEADLSAWVDLAAPGSFDVHGRYEAELVPGPSFPDRRDQVWDAAFDGDLRLDLR
ncbi:MAG: hypothetical protein H6738_18810 [Alphaproteobacteria bacterium]|nr:hypothetical protein [Alphaproteobacteria bacterium]MCB9698839.1 hypothetical protein [Alphaproteobacteria bacterium]